MTKTETTLTDEVLSLPVEMRIQLVDKLLESLNPPTPKEVEEAWAKEIERRIAEDERGEAKMIPGEEVMAELRRKYCK